MRNSIVGDRSIAVSKTLVQTKTCRQFRPLGFSLRMLRDRRFRELPLTFIRVTGFFSHTRVVSMSAMSTPRPRRFSSQSTFRNTRRTRRSHRLYWQMSPSSSIQSLSTSSPASTLCTSTASSHTWKSTPWLSFPTRPVPLQTSTSLILPQRSTRQLSSNAVPSGLSRARQLLSELLLASHPAP